MGGICYVEPGQPLHAASQGDLTNGRPEHQTQSAGWLGGDELIIMQFPCQVSARHPRPHSPPDCLLPAWKS